MQGPDHVLPAATTELGIVALVVGGTVLVRLLPLRLAQEPADRWPVAVLDGSENGSAIDSCHVVGAVLPAEQLVVRFPPPGDPRSNAPFRVA